MDVRLRVAVTDLTTVNVSALCVEHKISRQTFYKWRRRYLAGGVEALVALSRAPKSSPRAMSPVVVDEVIRLRKQLDELTGDSGPSSIPSVGGSSALGAAALDPCAVACGVLDGYVDCSTEAHGVWEYVAGALVCSEAGEWWSTPPAAICCTAI